MIYISLKEATKYCNYSQDYLKLRARQGKLKAIKIGRNWVTTRTWLQDYLSKIAQPQSIKLINCLTPGVRQVVKQANSVRPISTKPSLAQKIKILFLIFFILSLLIVGGIFSFQWKYSVNTFKAYFHWIENKAVSFRLEKILPARVIEINYK